MLYGWELILQTAGHDLTSLSLFPKRLFSLKMPDKLFSRVHFNVTNPRSKEPLYSPISISCSNSEESSSGLIVAILPNKCSQGKTNYIISKSALHSAKSLGASSVLPWIAGVQRICRWLIHCVQYMYMSEKKNPKLGHLQISLCNRSGDQKGKSFDASSLWTVLSRRSA